MLRIGVAPCSPFSVTGELLKQAAELARRNDVRMHTHLCETLDEEEFCRERFGCSPVEYMRVARTGSGRTSGWRTRCTCRTRRSPRWPRTGTSVAHCPTSNARLGAGICRSRDLRDAGVAVGLGVDGAASNEACSLLEEVRHALLFARAKGGPTALTVRDALEMATIGGAAVLGPGERDRLARRRQARRHRRLAVGHVGAHRHRRPGGGPGARGAATTGTVDRERSNRRGEGPAQYRRRGRTGPGSTNRWQHLAGPSRMTTVPVSNHGTEGSSESWNHR